MRPHYETEENRESEQLVKKIIELKWKCELEKLPDNQFIDFRAHRDGVVCAFVEVKERMNSITKYPTYMISAAKYDNGMKVSQQFAVPFLIAVCWDEGIYYHTVCANDSFERRNGGRMDRNDELDVEMCVFIPTSSFKLFYSLA
jgi:hypothetical protein